MRYDFGKMDPDSFELMIRSLAAGVFGIRCEQFGSGPDGQREFTYDGEVYDSTGVVLKGRTIGQVKYKSITTQSDDYTWLVRQVNDELQRFREKKKEYIPDNLIFYTNIVLTPARDKGIKDKINAYVKEHNDIIGQVYIKGYDEICAMLDNNRNVATCYAATILPGDLLIRLLEKKGEELTEKHLPNGNVIHCGHIEYFPSIIEATPFNYIYFLVSREQSGIAASLKELLRQYSDQVHAWNEYTVQSVLEGAFENLNECNKEGLLVYIDVNSISNIGLLIQKWRSLAGDNPMVVNVYAKGGELIEIAGRIKAILQTIDWGESFGNEQTEIDSLILVQTDRSSINQNVENIGKSGENKLEYWRILLSDRYYFKQVLKCRKQQFVMCLLCQRIPVCKGVKYIAVNRRLLERCDRERFIKHRYEWEEY